MKTQKNQKQITPLPYPYYFFTVLIAALTGLFSSIYLAVSHYRVFMDLGYQSFCAISQSWNCDTVSQSPYSILLGIPVPIWGIIGYAFFLWLLAYAWPARAQNRRIWTLLFVISLAFMIYSLVLAVISTFLIHSYCLMCILTYAVNMLLVYFCWMVRKRFHCENIYKAFALDLKYLLDYPRTVFPGAVFFCSGVFLLFFFLPAYWQMTPPVLSKTIPTGITEDGHPWIGAENPELVIVEFSDYMCFQCKKMHYHIRNLVKDNPDKIRLVHRHFPMDHTVNPIVSEPFYIGSAKLAIVSLFAAEKGKFWEMNDQLFEVSRQIERIAIRDLAEGVGISFEDIEYVFHDRQLWERLYKDIQAGLEHNINGTPGFIIDDQVFIGQIPPRILREYGIY